VVWSDAVFAAAALLSVTWWIPQLVRIARHGAAGVSSYTWAIAAANFLLWASRSALAGEPSVAVVELVQAAGATAIVVRAGVTRRVVTVAAVVAALLAVTHIVDPLATVVALGSSFVVRFPQLWSLLHRRGDEPNQVSATAWVISTAANALWVWWSVLNDHPYFAAGSVIAMGMSLAIAGASRRSREHAPAPTSGAASARS
jgi:hypothetical protein